MVVIYRLFYTCLVSILLSGCEHASSSVLFPSGVVAFYERDLIIITFVLMLLIVVPVWIMIGLFASHYAEGKKNDYDPNFVDSHRIEIVCWGIPILLITILAILTYYSTYKIDPYRPIASNKKPITVQVVSLDWKWLFIYPDFHIATVNRLYIPKDIPVHYFLTADAPMNSFWIPSIAGQIYTMTGMVTQLYTLSHTTGMFYGYGASFTGDGFSHMTFTVSVLTQHRFMLWIRRMHSHTHNCLTGMRYTTLAKQSVMGVKYFGCVKDALFYDIVNSYMTDGVSLRNNSSYIDSLKSY